jgi:MFS family permease
MAFGRAGGGDVVTDAPRLRLLAGLLGEQASAALAVAPYRRMFAASAFFNVGHFVQAVASSWYMLELTGSPFWVGLMVAAPQLPYLVLSLPAGALADIVDRRRLLQLSTTMMVVASGTMAVLWHLTLLTPRILIGLGLLLGAGATVYSPAWMSLVPRLLPMSLVPAGIGLNSTQNGITAALGPALGGVLVAALGAGPSFAIGALGYAVILLAVSPLSAQGPATGSSTIGMAIGTGVRYLRFSPSYRWLLLFGALFGFTSASFRSLLPNITSDALGGGSDLYGWLLACFGLGAAVGGLTRSRIARRTRHLIPLASVLFGLSSALLAFAGRPWVAGLALLLIGVAWTWVLATLNTVFQLLTPSWVLGRAMSAYLLSVFGLLPMGAFAAGALADLVGTAASQLVFSGLVVTLGLVSLRMPIPSAEGIDPPVLPEDEIGHVHTEVTPAPVMVTTTWEVQEDEFESLLEALAELRRIRLATGAYSWSVYRSVHDARRVTEVFMVHSWEQHLLQHRRLDARGIDLVLHAESFGISVVTDHLIAFDIADPEVRPRWQDQVPVHEQMHHGRRSQPLSTVPFDDEARRDR